MKKLLSLSVLIAMLCGCCNVEDTPQTEKKETSATYKVVFDANGGKGIMPEQIFTSGTQQPLNANVFKRTGYVFTEWNTSSDGTGAIYMSGSYYSLTTDIILYAQWEAEEEKKENEPTIIKTYTVTFDANGGSGKMGSQTFTYDVEQALTANTFTREGYTFAGWATTANGDVTYADEQKVSNLTAEDKATVTLYAVWNENDKVLPVIFSVASETAVDYGDSVTLSCDTEGVKISYTIDGVTAEYTDAIVITKDVTITAFATKDGMKKSDTTTASYTVKTYTMTYKSDYGTVPSKIVGLKKGDTLIEAQLPELTTDGYTFAGWYNGESEVTTEYKIICDLELSAKWNVNTYTVKFDANGGSGETADMSFNYDEEKALTKNVFTREDYTFAGWAVKADGNATYADMAKVKNLTAEDKATVILYAVWNENDKVLPVIFSVASETAVDYGDSVTLSCATDGAKISYTIGDETAEYTDAITITKDVTITAFATKDGMKDSDESTASYTVKTYTVTYKSDYDTAPSDVVGLKKDDTLTAEQLPVLTTDGYIFAGWYNGENEITTEYKIIGDLNLTAKWNANTDTAYKVEHYQQNIADDEYILAETDTETGTTDTDTVATAKDYAGFTAKSVEQAKIAADGSTVVKIYYDRNTISLTLNLDGGEGETEITGKYGAIVTTPANPTKTGYTFAEWNPSLPAIFTEDTAYTATWTANTYTITYNLNGGTNDANNPASYTVETETITLADATKNGDVFIGWYTDESFTNPITKIEKGSVGNIILYAKWRDAPIGDIVYSDGSISENYDGTKTPIGIVIEVSDKGVATKIVSLKQTSAEWGPENSSTEARSITDGKANMTAIQSIEGWETKCPAFKWCDDYTDDSGNSEWYLPAKNELNQLYEVKDYVNATIDKIIEGDGTATKLGTGIYWSSSLLPNNYAWNQGFSSGGQGSLLRGSKHFVRAVRAF